MAKTKVMEFSASNVKDIDSFLSEMNIKYIDLKVIQGKQTADTSLVLVYEKNDLNIASMIKGVWNASATASSIISNSRTALGTLTPHLSTLSPV